MNRRRKREAAHWFKVMCRDQGAFKAPYAGFMAYGIELGIPSSRATELAYQLVGKTEMTIGEVDALITEEARKWRR